MARSPMLRIPAAALASLAVLLVTSSTMPVDSSAAQTRRAVAGGVCAAGAGSLTLGFAGRFAGVSPDDHRSNLWEGDVTGPGRGDLRLTLEPLGSLMETANPVWRVRTRWIVSLADAGESPLVAELYGTVNWKTGAVRLSGMVTEGCLKGSEAVAAGRLVDVDASGTLEIQSAVALP